jgi:hypothetical protein
MLGLGMSDGLSPSVASGLSDGLSAGSDIDGSWIDGDGLTPGWQAATIPAMSSATETPARVAVREID